jgi:predicted SAM-dependent methyltransferase
MQEQLTSYSDIFKKYNLGCGTHIYPEYLNIGYWSDLDPGGLYKDLNGTKNTYMLNHNLTNGIPAEDNSLDLVYHSHMLEHLSYIEGIKFMRECHRVLKPGAKMRILVPDLEIWIKAYTDNNVFFFNEYKKILDDNIYTTKASIFMGMLHNHGHKCGYDYESLKWLAEHAGFSKIKKTLYADSDIDNIHDLEPMLPLKIMESLCVDCIKPY